MAWPETPRFRRECDRLSKRYRHLEADLARTLDNPATAWRTLIGSRGLLQKARVRSRDIPGGARHGFRVIRAVYGEQSVLVSIFAKAAREDLSRDDYDRLLDDAISALVELGILKGPPR